MTLLGQAGLRPVMVGDGAAAVEAWEGGHWDLILMDVQMPVMDGVTAVREIRKKESKFRSFADTDPRPDRQRHDLPDR